jgi:divalent metal cation (Fe/Co/Zn/Cd) transporter
MAALVGAFLVALLIVGTAALSGYPLLLIAAALAVGCAILAVMWRVRTVSAARSTEHAVKRTVDHR